MTSVSILIPNFNHADYLHQSLAGACKQTVPATEILVCDDGSSDESVRIIEEFAAKYPNLKLLRNKQNSGMQYTINRLLNEAKGKYIVCAAADDELYPKFIERHMERLARHPEAGMSCSEFMTLGTDGKVSNHSRLAPQSFGLTNLPDYLPPKELKAIFSKRYIWMSSNAIVCRKDALVKVGGFIKEQEWHSDWFSYYAVGFRHGVCLIPEGLGVIRVAPGGYSDAGMRDYTRQKEVLKSIIRSACQPPNDDLRKVFRDSPAALSVFGTQLGLVFLSTPQYWDMAVPYWFFMVNRYKRNNGGSWAKALSYAIKKTLV